MAEETWASASLAKRFADDAYATVKGYVRTFVMHQHLLENLPGPPARLLDVGGGAGHQSFPLAEAGYDVTLLDSSAVMLEKARQRLEALTPQAQQRVTLVQAQGQYAQEAVNGELFDAVLCHGVLGYVEDPESFVEQLCRCARSDGVVSIMTGNARTTAIQPALERRWNDALAAFHCAIGTGVLGVRGRGGTGDADGDMMRSHGVEPQRWYGVWLFVDWLEFSGTQLDPDNLDEVGAIAAVELEASRRDPYRQLSRVFHLVGRKRAPRLHA